MRKFITIIFTSAFTFSASAGSPEKVSDLLKNEIKLKLNDEGTAWTKISFATQFWVRYTDLNPGSTNKVGNPLSSETEFALRRTRMVMNNNLNDIVALYTQLGFNNLNSTSGKPQIYFHDVYGMFRLIPKSFYIGFGLSGWNGLSRLSNTSYQRTLTVDNPGVNYPSVNHSDLESRQLGIFIKGTAGRISYRAIVAKPFAYNGLPSSPKINTGYEYPSEKLEYKGYFVWHLFDKEYFSSPYLDMTYLGTKKICNLGIGFDIYPESIAEFNVSGKKRLKNRNLFAADFMLEVPMKNNQTVSLYSVLYKYDFGKNYLRSSAVMNNWSGGTGWEGAGNSEFKVGTGNIIYTTLGYLFPKDFLKLPGRFQIFYALTNKNFEAISSDLQNHDFGANYYVAGQKLKFCMQYSLRPGINQSTQYQPSYKPSAIFLIQLAI